MFSVAALKQWSPTTINNMAHNFWCRDLAIATGMEWSHVLREVTPDNYLPARDYGAWDTIRSHEIAYRRHRDDLHEQWIREYEARTGDLDTFYIDMDDVPF